MEIASAVERMVVPVDRNFEKDQTTDADKLLIHDMLIPKPFSLKAVNNFNSSPPFGLCGIFNYLIYHSTDHDKQGLAAYKSFEDYRLSADGYVESLLTAQLNQEGVHVYVAKVRPLKERSTTISSLFSRVEVQTEVAFFRHDASVKVVEMGDTSTLRPPCTCSSVFMLIWDSIGSANSSVRFSGSNFSAAPNDRFLSNAFQRCLRLSGVLLKLCRLILGCAKKKKLSVRLF